MAAKPMDQKSRAKRKAARAKKRTHKEAKKASQKDTVVELNIDSLFDLEASKYLHGLFTPNPTTIPTQYPTHTVPSTPVQNPVPSSSIPINPLFLMTQQTTSPVTPLVQQLGPSLSQQLQQQQAGPSEPTSNDIPERLNELLKSKLKYVRKASVLRAEDKHSFIEKSRELAAADMDKLTRTRALKYKDDFFYSTLQNASLTKVKKTYLQNIDKYIDGHWADPPNMAVIEHPVYSKALDENVLKAAMIEHGIKPTKNMAVRQMIFELSNAGADVEPMT
jgi:hypothetical protein